MRNVRSQIDSTQGLDLSSKKRKGRPSLLTPTKVAALRTVNKQNRSFTLMQVSDQRKDNGLDYGTETVRRWFFKERAAKVARRIKPSLSQAQKKR